MPKAPTSTKMVCRSERNSAMVLQPSPPWHTALPGNPCTRTSIRYIFLLASLLGPDFRGLGHLAELLAFRSHEVAQPGKRHRPRDDALDRELFHRRLVLQRGRDHLEQPRLQRLRGT